MLSPIPKINRVGAALRAGTQAGRVVIVMAGLVAALALGLLVDPALAQSGDPTAPSHLSAWALQDGTGIVMTWRKPAEDSASITGYEIQRAVDDGPMTTLVADTGRGAPHTSTRTSNPVRPSRTR